MLKKIIGTAGTRIIIGFILLYILGVHAKYLGTDNLGLIALFKVALSFNTLISAIFGGAAVVYLSNRIAPEKLILPAILWIVFVSVTGSMLQAYLNVYPKEYLPDLILISILFSLQVFYEYFLLYMQRIKAYNVSAMLHHLTLLGLTLYFIFGNHLYNPYAYIYAMYGALGVSCSYLMMITFTRLNYRKLSLEIPVIIQMVKYGFWAQVTNFIQTLNYRVCILFLDKFWGKSVVGYFSACLQLAEAVWIIAKSLAVIQYARISSSEDDKYNISLTLLLSKISLIFSLLATLALLLIPESIYITYLGPKFTDVKTSLLLILPGILFFSITLIYCHYFSGKGNFAVNTVGSLICLIIISISAQITIPEEGVVGAALSNSIGHFFLLAYYVILILGSGKASLPELLPQTSDLKRLKTVMKDYFSKKEN